jgi:hypothetical protein
LNSQQQSIESGWSDEEQKDDEVDDERPLVVVLKPGDLTAEEAEAHAALEGHQNSADKG